MIFRHQTNTVRSRLEQSNRAHICLDLFINKMRSKGIIRASQNCSILKRLKSYYSNNNQFYLLLTNSKKAELPLLIIYNQFLNPIVPKRIDYSF